MQTAFQRGRLIPNKAEKYFELGPNLDIIPNVSAAYERAMDEGPENLPRPHRNRPSQFPPRCGLVPLHLQSRKRRRPEARFKVSRPKNIPTKPIIDGDPKSLPRNVDLDTYCIARIQEEVNDKGVDKTKLVLEGTERRAFISLIMDEDERYVALDRLCQKLWANYQAKIGVSEATANRIPLPVVRNTEASPGGFIGMPPARSRRHPPHQTRQPRHPRSTARRTSHAGQYRNQPRHRARRHHRHKQVMVHPRATHSVRLQLRNLRQSRRRGFPWNHRQNHHLAARLFHDAPLLLVDRLQSVVPALYINIRLRQAPGNAPPFSP